MRYVWAEGRSRSLSAQVVGDTIEAIDAEHGECTPTLFVEEAAAPESPLHVLLEWDDTKAAESHRLHQARMVINSVEIVINEPERIQVQAFVSIKKNGGRHYVPHVRLVTDDELYAKVVTELRKVINSYRRKLKGFEKFRRLAQTLDDI